MSHKIFGFPAPFLPSDRFGSPVTLIPKRKNVVILVGPELKYTIKGDTPTMEEVDAVHAEYFASIRKMFDENAGKHGYGDYNLIFNEEREAEAKKARLHEAEPQDAGHSLSRNIQLSKL